MLPPRCTIDPCMNIAVRTVTAGAGPPGGVSQAPRPVSSQGIAAWVVRGQSPLVAVGASRIPPRCSRK